MAAATPLRSSGGALRRAFRVQHRGGCRHDNFFLLRRLVLGGSPTRRRFPSRVDSFHIGTLLAEKDTEGRSIHVERDGRCGDISRRIAEAGWDLSQQILFSLNPLSFSCATFETASVSGTVCTFSCVLIVIMLLIDDDVGVNCFGLRAWR